MTEVVIEVHSDEGQYYPGTAHVFLDGKLIAKLRGGEGLQVVVEQPKASTSRFDFQ